MNEKTFSYRLLSSAFANVGVVWKQDQTGTSPMIVRILLPREGLNVKEQMGECYPGASSGSHPLIDPVMDRLGRYLSGEAVEFSPGRLDLSLCGAFQQKVLQADFQIPRGKVTPYSGLACRLSAPRAARAVGTALARNPFPLIIPCHRVVRSDGMLGGFGGGLKMKKALLEMEGVSFDRSGRVQKAHLRP
jgi:methylated-DNA-[protein]-cysteine S-methyltransferase